MCADDLVHMLEENLRCLYHLSIYFLKMESLNEPGAAILGQTG